MFDENANKLLDLIVKHSSFSKDEIKDMVQEKKTELDGLISTEGAIHIIANSLGVNLYQLLSSDIKISEIIIGLRNVITSGKVIQIFPVTEFNKNDRQGKVGSFIMGDETGTIRVVCWNEKANMLQDIKEGDIIKVHGAYVRNNFSKLELHCGDRTVLTINPEGINIKSVSSSSVISGDGEKKEIHNLSENDRNVEISGTIVQAFEPRFFTVCKQCGKRARQQRENEFFCDQHGIVDVNYSYVFNAIVDDGLYGEKESNIRTVFFRERLSDLTKMSDEEIRECKDNPEKLEKLVKDLMLTNISVRGNVKKNSMFDRLEFMATTVSHQNVEEDLQALSK